ncbi:ABC transporter substrate-binding protein [Subtercola frigoramans]
MTTVSFALSYIPDPSLNGLSYAIDQGWFAEQGITVDIVPFGSSPAETLVSTGVADLGFGSDIRSVLIAQAAGADVKSFFTTYQHVPYSLTVLADSSYNRPADLAGTTFGTFGSPSEVAVADDMITADGGSKGVEPVTLSTDIYSALSQGRVDSTLSFPGDAFAIEQTGHKVRTWSTTDFGLPDTYSGLLLSSTKYADAHPDIVRKFTQVMQRGYEAALSDPAAANAAVLKQFPNDLSADLVDYVSKIQNASLIPGPTGVVGFQSADIWQQNADWLIKHGLLVDANGQTLSTFDTSPLFTIDDLTK